MTNKKIEHSETNKTYCKLRKLLNDSIDERLAGSGVDEDESPSKKIDDGVYTVGLATKDGLGGGTHTKEGKTHDVSDSEEEKDDQESMSSWLCCQPETWFI